MGLVAGVQLILPLHQPQLQIKAVHCLILNYQEYAYSLLIFFLLLLVQLQVGLQDHC